MRYLNKIREKRWLFLIMGVVLMGGGVGTYFLLRQPTDTQANEPQMQTATVRQGDLEVRASGSAVLIAMDPITLSFGVSGPVAELLVTAGDYVEAGDVLSVQGDQDELEAEVASTQLAVLEAEEALDDLLENAELYTAQAQLALANAMDALDKAEYTWTVRQKGNRASATTLEAAQANLILAEEEVNRAQSKYDQARGDANKALALSNLAAAKQNRDSIQRNINWYLGEPDEIEQALLDAELAEAQATAAVAEREYEKVKDGPDPEQVAKLELRLDNAIGSWEDAKNNLENATILAPIDGTILEVTASVGDIANSGFITMADLSQPHLEVYLDETDLDKIDLNFEVEVVFDALPDSVFTGRVIQIDPSLYTSQNVSAVKGLVKIDEDKNISEVVALPLGVNASVDVIAGRAEGIALVPVEALRQIGTDEFTVFVVQGEELELRTVVVGLIDITYAAVTEGLEPGEVVSTGIVEAE